MDSNTGIEILRFFAEKTDPYLAMLWIASVVCFFIIGLSGAVTSKDETHALEHIAIYARRFCLVFPVGFTFIALLGLYILAIYHLGNKKANSYIGLVSNEALNAITSLWPLALLLVITPIFLSILHKRFLKPKISAFIRRWRVRQSGEALSDIRDEVAKLKSKDYDPKKYYKEGYMFVGLDEKNKPVYIEDSIFKKNHIKALGPSQTGKGVIQGVLLHQAIHKGWGAWFFDQKPDDFIYDIMLQACEESGREPPIVIDLNGIGPGKYSPFANGTYRERRERVLKAFDANSSGTNADFYKARERKCFDQINHIWDGSLYHLKRLLEGRDKSLSEKDAVYLRENSEGIVSNLSEWLMMDALNPKKGRGFNVAESLKNNRVVYIRGNLRDPLVTKALISSMEELVQTSLRHPPSKHTLLSIDELRFVASDTIADSLATLLSKNVNSIVAYQGIDDLLNLKDQRLNAKSIKSGIETNTQITLSMRCNGFETAEWLAQQTGDVYKSVSKFEKVSSNRFGGEEWDSERSIAKEKEFLITTNKLMQLPPRVGVVIQPNKLAEIIYTCYVPIKNPRGMPLKESLEDDNNSKSQTQDSQNEHPDVIIPDELQTVFSHDFSSNNKKETTGGQGSADETDNKASVETASSQGSADETDNKASVETASSQGSADETDNKASVETASSQGSADETDNKASVETASSQGSADETDNKASVETASSQGSADETDKKSSSATGKGDSSTNKGKSELEKINELTASITQKNKEKDKFFSINLNDIEGI